MVETETMQDFKPHTFDIRGLRFAFVFFGIGIGLLSAVRYGVAIADVNFFKETQVATVAPTSPSPIIQEPAPVIPTNPTPKVSADAYVIAEINSGTVLASKDSESAYPIASISKLLVALVARDTLTPTTTVMITNDDRRQTEGYPGSISRVESFAAQDLFYALLMESNNSVAYAFARTFGTEEFIRLMLRKGHAIGMDETLLNDSSGLSERNTASARDLLKLIGHIYHNAPELLDITSTKSKAITAESGRKYSIPNFNHFAGRSDFVGGKTGYTDEARETYVGVFDVGSKSGTSTVAIVVLHSSDRRSDVLKLLEWYKQSVN
jgi:serine-type D-Ala-D-Ala carboxypeptidase (penicillin-binding protein 5/6)